MLEQTIKDGSALEKFKQMIIMQDGDPAVIDDYGVMPQAQYHIPIVAERDGIVTKIAADEMGIASMRLGGGRSAKDDQLDYAVGLVLHHKVGDKVRQGEPLVTVHSNQKEIDGVEKLIRANFIIGDQAPTMKLIHEVITK